MSTHDDPLAPTVHTAYVWLGAVAENLDTDDHRFALRALRAWLHTVRDRIGVDSSAHLSAQLPELLRGIYYENWVPGHIPVRHGLRDFLTQFSREAGIEPGEVPAVVAPVTFALEELFSPGLLSRTFAVMPVDLYRLYYGAMSDIVADAEAARPGRGRTAELARQVVVLAEAVTTLTHGLEQLPTAPDDDAHVAQAARRAHDLLLAGGLDGEHRPEGVRTLP